MELGGAGAVFAAAAGLVLYAYVGYPAALLLLARLRPAPPVRRSEATPHATVVIVACNEERRIGAKIENCLALDYPKDRLDVLVASDGSRDGTVEVVRSFADRGVRVLDLPGPNGKAVALNRAVPECRGEILLLTDARQVLDALALRRLAAAFADPAVGAVSGELHLVGPGGPGEGVGLYWRYEKMIRLAESRLDSTVGVTGAIYALRRELFAPLDPRTILDDVAIPMHVVLAGYRVLFEPGARATDHLTDDLGHEYRRKVRTLAGNFQLTALRPTLLNPFRNRLVWQYTSHKLARLAVPWCLLALLASSAALAARGDRLHAASLGAQAAFYLLALGGWATTRYRRPVRWLALPYTFLMLNAAAATGLFRFLSGRATAAWRQAS